MFLIFLYEESYLKFLVAYMETKKMDPNEEDEDFSDEESKMNETSRIQKSYSITFQKNTKVTESDTQKVSKFLHIKELGKELKERTESMNLKKMQKSTKGSPAQKNSRNSIIVENELKNLLLISTFTDQIRDSSSSKNSPLNSENNTPRQKTLIEKDLTKEEIAKYERKYFILAQGGIFSGVFSKNEKILRFSCENLELQFDNPQNRKFICSYILHDIGTINRDGDKQITLNFKSIRKLKNLSMIFANAEDLNEFMDVYQFLSKRKKKYKHEVEFKDFLKKNLRRYSWLNQPLNALLPKKTSAEYSFQIINENFSPLRQLLHINFIHRIISFLKKEKEKAVILKEFSIHKIMHLENNYNDSSKITLKLDKKKSIGIMFSNVQNKLVFESATNAILVINLIFFFFFFS